MSVGSAEIGSVRAVVLAEQKAGKSCRAVDSRREGTAIELPR